MLKLFEVVERKPIELSVLSDKKPKELKGKNKIASVKDEKKSYQIFIDDNYNLYYKDNSVLVESKSCIKRNEYGVEQVEVMNYYAKIWFKIVGLYERKNDFILDILRDLSRASEELYTQNSVSDNVRLERLYEKLIKEYLKYLKINGL